MSELRIVVNCKSMLISTPFFRFCKGIEQFYYAMLFAAQPYAAQGASPWLSWMTIGFHVATREAPPGAAEADRIRVDTLAGRTFEVRVNGSNRGALEKLRDLIAELDRVRKSLTADDEPGRLAEIHADRKIDALLMTPLRNSLTRDSVPEKEAFAAMMDRGLLALCNRQITSMVLRLD
jgi:hypothetical protein